MKKHLKSLIFRLICTIYPRFPVQRAVWLVRLYAGEPLSKKWLAMLEADARRMLAQRRQLDALRILHCGLLLNPDTGSLEKLAREIIAKRGKSEKTNGKNINGNIPDEHQNELKMRRFSWYVMQAVDRGSFARLSPPKV